MPSRHALGGGLHPSVSETRASGGGRPARRRDESCPQLVVARLLGARVLNDAVGLEREFRRQDEAMRIDADEMRVVVLVIVVIVFNAVVVVLGDVLLISGRSFDVPERLVRRECPDSLHRSDSARCDAEA